MSFFYKFQYHYHEKQLEILSTSDKHEEVLSYLEKLSDKNKIFQNLLPPLKLLDSNQKKELLTSLTNLEFEMSNLKAA